MVVGDLGSSVEGEEASCFSGNGYRFELVGATEKCQFHRRTMGFKLSPLSDHPMVPCHRASTALDRKGLY